MTFPGLKERVPLLGFFLRVEKMATAAFLTIPYVGDSIANYFNQVVIPVCTPTRDRIMRRLFGSFGGLEGKLQVLLMRLMPLPSEPAEDPSRGSQ